MEKAELAKLLAFWEKCFPGKSVALMEILLPFYGWKPELKPAFPGLEERAKSAILWKEVRGVRIFKFSSPDSLWNSLSDLLGVSFGVSLRHSLFYACSFVLVGKPDEATKFKPLLNFFLVGNYPIGFDEEDNLLILVAD